MDRLLEQVNAESEKDPGFVPKTLNSEARYRLSRHDWPGNVRELLNTLRRIAVWSEGPVIGVSDVEAALFKQRIGAPHGDQILDQSIGEGFNLEEQLSTVEKHYLERALKIAGNNKSEAARLLGISGYMSLTYRLEKHGIAPKRKRLRRSS